ncbi:uncharacterized protein (DUF433 family) [Actinokineospora baliensis]|uniref:DUF433 domain-containing protein n=1 Tax=Actinokineospora baliensis TaxID=547056 RepID=UPI00195914AE|nr:DUF433 domain-containing protein [Actinokineospora baliensis]MBM7770136.1 uncharacterized protein (DUF433 family) [Actinokineospora baliensis]
MGDVVPLLDRPVYTYPQVDRLLALSTGTADRWFNGYARRGVAHPPMLRQESSRSRWVTWGEFVEARLFASYRDIDKIPTSRLRAYTAELRRVFDERYPLAHSAPYVRREGRLMLWEAQQTAELGDDFAVEVRTDQIVLSPLTEQFYDSADFDDRGTVHRLRPDADFPDVYLDPRRRGGEPTIAGHNVTVATIASLIRGGERIGDIAQWYRLDDEQVRQAIGYDAVHLRIA